MQGECMGMWKSIAVFLCAVCTLQGSPAARQKERGK